MKHIVKENGSINTPIYELDGKKYQIIGSRTTGIKAMETMDTVKNLETGERRDIARYQLFLYTRRNGTHK